MRYDVVWHVLLLLVVVDKRMKLCTFQKWKRQQLTLVVHEYSSCLHSHTSPRSIHTAVDSGVARLWQEREGSRAVQNQRCQINNKLCQIASNETLRPLGV